MAGVDLLASAFGGANAAFIGDLYARWATDPHSVDRSFAEIFEALNDEARAVLSETTGASWAPRHVEAREQPAPADAPAAPAPVAFPAPAALTSEQIRAATIASLRALMLIRTYRVRGHLEARLDPLGLSVPAPHPELDPRAAPSTPRPSAQFCSNSPRRKASRCSARSATSPPSASALRAVKC